MIVPIVNEVSIDVKKAADAALSREPRPEFNMWGVASVLEKNGLDKELAAIRKWQKSWTQTWALDSYQGEESEI